MKFPFKPYRSDLVTTLVAEHCHIKGSIHSQQSVHIDGMVEGEVHSQGEIVIGEKGRILGKLIGKNIIVAGEIRGPIEATKSLKILKTGKVFGDIVVDQFWAEEGALYQGQVNVDSFSSRQ